MSKITLLSFVLFTVFPCVQFTIYPCEASCYTQYNARLSTVQRIVVHHTVFALLCNVHCTAYLYHLYNRTAILCIVQCNSLYIALLGIPCPVQSQLSLLQCTVTGILYTLHCYPL